MAKSSREFSELIINNQKRNEGIQVVLGGDHSVSFSSMLAQLTLNKSASLGMIQFDTHADINNYTESPTKNFHGMWLRALIDKDFDSQFVRDIPTHFNSRNLLYVGNLKPDPGEKNFIDNNMIPSISRDEIIKDRQKVINKVNNFVNRFEHIHVSFDIDVFDISLASATGTPSRDGLFKNDIYFILDILSKKEISVDLVELNPKKIGSRSTIELAQEVLLRLII